jgi:hypothetical protein
MLLGAAIPARSNDEKGEVASATEARERRPLKDANGVPGLVPRSDFVRLDTGWMRELSSVYYNDTLIRQSAQMVCTHVFSGKVRIQRTGESEALDEHMSAIWSSFGLQVLEQQDQFGFAAATFVSDPVYRRVPRVLNLLDGIEIRHRVNIYNEQLFAFYQRATNGLFTDIMPIPNVYVFCYTPPTINGHIISSVNSLLPHVKHLSRMTVYSQIAESRRCNPPVLTETVERKTIADVDIDPVSRIQVSPADERRLSMLDKLARHANTIGVHSPGVLMDKMDTILSSLNGIGIGPIHELEAGKRYVNSQLAEGPANIDKLRVMNQQLCMMEFGIPPAMMQAESTHGKIGHNADARKTFDGHINMVKDRITGYIADMYHIMWDKQTMRNVIVGKPITEPLSDEEVVSSTSIQVSIPGRPSEETYKELYREGSLKRDAYIRYQSGMHHIPLESFETEPTLSLLDILTTGKESIERIKAEKKQEQKKPLKKKKKKET